MHLHSLLASLFVIFSNFDSNLQNDVKAVHTDQIKLLSV